MKTAAQALARYTAGATGAGTTWSDAIQNTQIDVMGRAIAAKSVAAQNFQRVMSDGSYEKAVQASGGTANWKAQTEAKKANYEVGIQAGLPKFQSAIEKILSAEARIVSGLPARVPGNPQANLARVAGVVNGLHALKGTLKG